MTTAYDVKTGQERRCLVHEHRREQDRQSGRENHEGIAVDPPTPGSAPRRMEIGSDGMICSGEFRGGKMARFDPKTETFKEFPLPGRMRAPTRWVSTPTAIIWYDSHDMDMIGRFDPRTGNVIEYPFPHSEIAMREFFRDAQGRMWYGTAPNNKVGYFYLAGGSSK